MAISDIRISNLTKEWATVNAEALAAILSRIPKVPHAAEDVTADKKRGLELNGKWRFSLVACDSRDKPIGVLLTYIRPVEDSLYVIPTFYLSGLAVREDREGRGVATDLINKWLAATEASDLAIEGHVIGHSTQTNAAPFNAKVKQLYERLGFRECGSKSYDNRIDVVLIRRFPASIEQA